MTIVNGAIQTVDSIINFAAFKVLYPAANAAMRADMPWLNWPIISTLFDALMTFVMKYFYNSTIDYANLVVIKLQTDAEKSAYSAAEQTLRKTALTGDKNAITKASSDFDTTLGTLIRFDGS